MHHSKRLASTSVATAVHVLLCLFIQMSTVHWTLANCSLALFCRYCISSLFLSFYDLLLHQHDYGCWGNTISKWWGGGQEALGAVSDHESRDQNAQALPSSTPRSVQLINIFCDAKNLFFSYSSQWNPVTTGLSATHRHTECPSFHSRDVKVFIPCYLWLRVL